MRLTVGDVIFWDDFPFPRRGFVKARWFIYLGRASVFSTPVFAYLCTTTTQIQHFEPGGSRCNHTYKRFDVRQFPQFDRDCILDFEEEIHDIPESTIERCEAQIEIRGRLDENTMRNIFKQLSRSGLVSAIALRDIIESFNRDGITGLKKSK